MAYRKGRQRRRTFRRSKARKSLKRFARGGGRLRGVMNSRGGIRL